jgi:hypothetical protein
MDLSFRFQDNDKAHGDLILCLGDKSWECDSYYLALDRSLLPDREDGEKIRAVLLRLLELWLEAVEQIPEGGTAYLPYDLSDQYTGWLECQRSGAGMVVSRGWADIEGWSFFPSTPGNLYNRPRGFRVDGPTVRCGRAEVIEAIRGSLARV